MKRASLLLIVLAGAASAAALPACFAPISCTDVGCENGAELRVFDASGGALDSFTGVARFADGSTASFACPPPDGQDASAEITVTCLPGGVQIGHIVKVIVGVSIDSSLAPETADVDLAPELHETAPNGEECGPICPVADVDVHLAPAS
jgi:hypothetical protein